MPCFVARGRSPVRKLFQANRIYRSQARFAAPNWLVGGDTDADSNLCIGIRVGLFAEGEGIVVRGNYLHLRMPITKEFPYYSQVSTFSTSKGALGEHNVIRDGEWIVRFVEGEFRYNLVTDILDHDLMQNGSAGRVHHNLFVAGRSDSRQGSMFGCIAVMLASRLLMAKNAAIAPMSQMSCSLKPCVRSTSKSRSPISADRAATFTAKSSIARWRGVRSASR